MATSLPQWLAAAADEEALNLKPLPAHGAAEHDEHTRERYAWLLAALLAQQEAVSETQSRLFYLLLIALNLGDCRAALFEAVRQLEKADLVDAARVVREAKLGDALVLDAMVLLRLDKALTEEQARMLADLAALLGLKERTLNAATEATAITLGLHGELPPPSCGDLSPKARAVWMGKGTFILDAAALAAGIDGGRWRVMETIEVNFGWRIENAEVIFEPGASIITVPGGDKEILIYENGKFVKKTSDVVVAHCKFINPVIVFNSGVAAEHCTFTGEYPQDEARTAIAIRSYSKFSHCHFSTRNAQALAVGEYTSCHVEYCEFTDCGGSENDGGAISVSGSVSRGFLIFSKGSVSGGSLTAKKSRFLNCSAQSAGAIYGVIYGDVGSDYTDRDMKNISLEGCEFIDCGQIKKDGSQGSDLAVSIYCGNEDTILNSQFKRCSVYFQRVKDYSTPVRNCEFTKGNIQKDKSGNPVKNEKCVFS